MQSRWMGGEHRGDTYRSDCHENEKKKEVIKVFLHVRVEHKVYSERMRLYTYGLVWGMVPRIQL